MIRKLGHLEVVHDTQIKDRQERGALNEEIITVIYIGVRWSKSIIG